MSNVTNLKTITNNLIVPITVKNNENTQQTFTVANRAGWNGDLWIPWVDNQDQMMSKGIMIEWRIGEGLGRIYVFQHGDQIYYATNENFDHKNPISGIRGEKALIMEGDYQYRMV